METLPLYLAMSLTTIVGLSIVSMVGLWAFKAWIGFKQMELSHNAPAAPPSAAQRIDVADLKERIRKLEAIASGVEL